MKRDKRSDNESFGFAMKEVDRIKKLFKNLA